MQMQTKASKGSCRLDRRKCPLQCSESSTESSRAEQRSRLSYRAVVGLAAAPRPGGWFIPTALSCVDGGCGAVSNCSAGRPGTYRRPGWTRTRSAATRCTTARELQWPWWCCRWISHHFGSSVWVGLQRPRISVWAHRRMFDKSYASPPGS